MKKTLALAVILLAGFNAQAKTSMAAIRINNLDAAMEEVAGLMEIIQIPMPLDQATAPLGGFLMSAGLEGIDTSKPITIYIGAEDDEEPSGMPGMPSLALRFSVEGDGSAYIESVGAMLPTHEKQSDTVHKFPMGPPGDDSMAFYVVIKNGQALVGYNMADIQSLVKSVSREDSDLLAQFPGNLSFWMNTVELEKTMSSKIDEYNEMMEEIKTLGVDDSGEEDSMDPAAMMESYNNMAGELLKQIESLIVSVDFNQKLSLRAFIKAKPDTMMASMMNKMTPPGAPVANMDIPGALFGGFGTMDGMDELLEIYGEWIADLYESMGPPMSGFGDSYEEMINSMNGIYKGGYSFYLLPPKVGSLLQLFGIYGISDKQKAKESMDAMMALEARQMASLSAMFDDEEGDAEEEAEEETEEAAISEPVESEYRGLNILTYNMGMDIEDEIADVLPEGYANMMSGLAYHTSLTDEHLYYSIGDIANLDPVIDHISAGAAGPSSVSGFSDISAEPISYWFIDIPAVIQAFAGALQIPGSENLNLSETPGMIRGLAIKEHGGLSSIIRLTGEDIQGLVQMGMQLSMLGGASAQPLDEFDVDISDPPEDSEALPEELPEDFEDSDF